MKITDILAPSCVHLDLDVSDKTDLLTKLVATAGRAPVSFEAVWRESRLVKAGSETTRVSFEARSSAVLDLQP